MKEKDYLKRIVKELEEGCAGYERIKGVKYEILQTPKRSN